MTSTRKVRASSGMRIALAIAVLSSLLLGSGCATITTGNSQNVTVNTDPPGAVCTLSREGKTVGVVNPTPGTLSVTKGHAELAVSCVRPDYLESSGTVGSKFQAMTFGNILFGGLVGVVIDAASGATAEYEPVITIRLVPASFASAEERDAFFVRRREEFLAEARTVKERIEKMCSDDTCAKQLAEAEKGREAGLARIEEQRQTARIVPAAPR